MSKIIDLMGQRFGQLTVIGRAPSTKAHGFACWVCRCDCGLMHTVPGVSLRSGRTTTCGHLSKEMLKAGLHASHGGSGTPEYDAWIDMRRRCGTSYWKNVRVCARWRKSFKDFLKDMGERPGPGYSLDRYPDKNGNYRPGNVRWATASEQANNRRLRGMFDSDGNVQLTPKQQAAVRNRSSNVWVEYDGMRMTLIDACERAGLKWSTVYSRIKRGWAANDALRASLAEGKQVRTASLTATWAKRTAESDAKILKFCSTVPGGPTVKELKAFVGNMAPVIKLAKRGLLQRIGGYHDGRYILAQESHP